MAIDPERFVEVVRGPLEQHNGEMLSRVLHEQWSDEQVIALLDCDHADARKLAALALGFIGDQRCITPLAACLRDSDAMVNQMAEHALWTVWFRCGSKQAQEALHRGSECLSCKRLDDALRHFARAVQMDPTYAEAFNQRSIAQYLVEDYHEAIDDAQIAVQLMPCHFGAWAGMGHCFAHLGDTRRALNSYRRALGINPYLAGIRQIVQEIQNGRCSCQRDEVRY